jgi:Tfp pilus assembly protein PilF
LHRAIIIDPDNTEVHCYRGKVYNKRLKHKKVIKDFDKAIKIDSNFAEVIIIALSLTMDYLGDRGLQ